MNSVWNVTKTDNRAEIQLNYRFKLDNGRKYNLETKQSNCRFNSMSRTNSSVNNISATSMRHSAMQSNEHNIIRRRNSFG